MFANAAYAFYVDVCTFGAYVTGMDVKGIVSAFGGIRGMADKLGHKSHTTVQGWSDRNLIPAQRQPEVLDAAVRHGITLSAADLVQASRPESAAA